MFISILFYRDNLIFRFLVFFLNLILYINFSYPNYQSREYDLIKDKCRHENHHIYNLDFSNFYLKQI